MKEKIPLIPEPIAQHKICPFFKDEGGFPFNCILGDCMAWHVVQPTTSREDHSGGRDMMQTMARNYGCELTREGPPGSQGFWSIPALGYCKRLWPNAQHPTMNLYDPPKGMTSEES